MDQEGGAKIAGRGARNILAPNFYEIPNPAKTRNVMKASTATT
jgi:hypothetical protein